MVRKCFICGNPNKPLFEFPSDMQIRTKWLTAISGVCDISKLKEYSTLCINHFDQKFVKVLDKKTRLIKDAVPTVTAFDNNTTFSVDAAEEYYTSTELIFFKDDENSTTVEPTAFIESTPRNHPTSNFSDEVFEASELQNVLVSAVYNESFRKIVLNVSWDKPLGEISFYDFQVTPNITFKECSGRPLQLFKKNRTLTSTLLPQPYDGYPIKPLCTYTISITRHLGELGRKITDVVYTVPECVGKVCSCKYLTPQVNDLKVVELAPGTGSEKFNVSWSIDQNMKDEAASKITSIAIGSRKGNWGFFRPIIKISNVTEDMSHFTFNTSFLPGEQYQLQATFYNAYKCLATPEIVTVTAAKPYVNEKSLTDSAQPKIDSWEIILLIVVVSIFILIVMYIVRRNRRVLKQILLNPSSLRFSSRGRHSQDIRASFPVASSTTKRRQEANVIYVEKEILDGTVDRYELPRAKIDMIREIGKGEFGKVYLAEAFCIRGQPGYPYVAVKTLREKASAEEMNEFLLEIEILKKVGEHPNVVALYGCCILKEPYLMVMELVPCGNLLEYLLELRRKWLIAKQAKDRTTSVSSDTSDGAYIMPDSPTLYPTSEGRPSLTETEYTTTTSGGYSTDPYAHKLECNLDHTELQDFALQIAKGMEHLESIPIVHRDLAARNILVNQYKTLKISDFGLSKIGPYVNRKSKRLPLRWWAIEAIEDNFCDSKSDVWSFAVVLWEIGTLGALPYENVADRMLENYLISGKRLSRPEICTDDFYALMLRCWSHEPDLRPSFHELVELLDVKKKRIYVDFNQLNPLYMFPPSKLLDYDKLINTSNT